MSKLILGRSVGSSRGSASLSEGISQRENS